MGASLLALAKSIYYDEAVSNVQQILVARLFFVVVVVFFCDIIQ